MDISSVLTTLWGKVSKPLPNILIGGVFLFLAPDQFSWLGYIFLALGASGFCEWAWPHILSNYSTGKVKRKIQNLNTNEFQLLNTVRLNSGVSIPSHSAENEKKSLFEQLLKLEAQKLLNHNNWSSYTGNGHSFYVPYQVQEELKNIIENGVR